MLVSIIYVSFLERSKGLKIVAAHDSGVASLPAKICAVILGSGCFILCQHG